MGAEIGALRTARLRVESVSWIPSEERACRTRTLDRRRAKSVSRTDEHLTWKGQSTIQESSAMASIVRSTGKTPKKTPTARLVAVIDMGTTSIRLAVGQIDGTGIVETVETLSQAVSLGKDTFTIGSIGPSTTEQCVRVLKSYREFLAEYDIVDPKQVRVVATTAVREADNLASFVNRIFVATGFRVEPIDEAEVNRVTYLSVQPLLQSEPRLAEGNVLITEVGGGSTDVLLVQQSDVSHTHTYRLGSLRLRKALETVRAPATAVRNIMEDHISRIVEQIGAHVSRNEPLELIALGGDVRFVATQLHPDWEDDRLARIPLQDLERLTEDTLNQSVDDLVRRHHLTFPDAETLGPALLTYVHIARALGLKDLIVSNANLRDGLFRQMAVPDAWSDGFKRQIIRSALDMGRRFRFDEAHACHVADLSVMLFRQLEAEHHLEARYELLLYIAALLHDIGYVVSQRNHHKHSMYLINNGELFGLSRNDILLVALVARYHRRAAPKPVHEGYGSLDWEDRINVAKMASLLRVADALDHANRQRVHSIECQRDNGRLVIRGATVDDLSLEQLALEQKGALFEEVFGRRIVLRKG